MPRSTPPGSTAGELAAQWMNPTDIFSVLLLLGPEIVRHAVAQLAGHRVTPVAFSFGWVAYSANALLAVFGDGRLMPEAASGMMVIGVKSGHVRTTRSWTLTQLFRSLNDKVDREMREEQAHINMDKLPDSPKQTRPAWEPLRISVYDAVKKPAREHSVPSRDWVWYSGFIVILLQLAVAAIPLALHGEPWTLAVTVYGNVLALLEGSLPQWTREKWPCPRTGGATVILTQGNGTRHAVLIRSDDGTAPDFEILAVGARTTKTSSATRVAVALLTANWIVLLITAAGLRLSTWYLFCIGAIGSVQNIIAAGMSRNPGALGIHIQDSKDPIRGSSVKDVLRRAEESYPGVGVLLAPVFFPDSMRVKEDEEGFWRDAQQKRLKKHPKWGTRIDRLIPAQFDDSTAAAAGGGKSKRVMSEADATTSSLELK